MDGYTVQIAELGGLIDNLVQAANRITDANAALRGASPADLGTAGIDRAGAEFHDRWEHGTRKIGEFSGRVVDGLGRTRRDYQAVEDAVARLFAGAASAAPSGASDSRIGKALGGGS